MKEEVVKTISKIEDLVLPVIKNMGLELVDIEYMQDGGYWYVRIFIEKLDEDISLDECAKLSLAIDEDIDKLIDKKFFLEISSPGIERPLKRQKDFMRFIGSKIKVSLKHKIDEIKNYEGMLKNFENDTLYLEIGERSLEIPFKEVRKANLVYDFKDI